MTWIKVMGASHSRAICSASGSAFSARWEPSSGTRMRENITLPPFGAQTSLRKNAADVSQSLCCPHDTPRLVTNASEEMGAASQPCDNWIDDRQGAGSVSVDLHRVVGDPESPGLGVVAGRSQDRLGDRPAERVRGRIKREVLDGRA